jgi:hypothetical protein
VTARDHFLDSGHMTGDLAFIPLGGTGEID